ncbi:hypothetical protein QBC43DRAFT_327786 [Cladorrhinum sp. PSN259]|nr:hypothetical protein QBC43DRAFT_327786 [Cladorrhinum sp. PSN259]
MKVRNWKLLVLITNDRVSLETSSTTWEDAVKQLTEYMLYARINSGKEEEDTFGIVAVGHFSRFYILKPASTTLIDHPATGGNLLEFKNNETDIVNLLLEIKAQALLVPSDWSRSNDSDSDG